VEGIRPESETDRTEAALMAAGIALPLSSGDVEVVVEPAASESLGGQRIVATLVNQLARMKGLVQRIYLQCDNAPIRESIPLQGDGIRGGLTDVVESLNHPASEHRAELRIGLSDGAAARVHIGAETRSGLTVASTGWCALVGAEAELLDFEAGPPFGSAMAAVIGAAEVFKQLLAANFGSNPNYRPVGDLRYSLLNSGLGADAHEGPAEQDLDLSGWAVAGVGAGGSAALYVAAMLPRLHGQVDLIEPGYHKLSNLNRYLMTTADQVQSSAQKLDSAMAHLRQFAPDLDVIPHKVPWELLAAYPWDQIVSTVDTEEARWNIQTRSREGAEILDGAVNGLMYNVLRVAPGGWCLFCKHPFDPKLDVKRRAARWGEGISRIEEWIRVDEPVSWAMVKQMATIRGRPAEDYATLVGHGFRAVPELTECGETPLRTDVPSQAPVLPMATTAVGTVLAAEIAKGRWAPEYRLDNWLAHDLARAPGRVRVVKRTPLRTCRLHPR
jgi:molybdopterin/thiamine biosynthesis adenylyltransferase